MTERSVPGGYSRRLSEDELGAWRAFLRAHASLTRRLERDLADAGSLCLREYDVLVNLVRAGEQGMRLTDLAQQIVLTKSGMTRLVDRLERLGYVQCHVSPADRRVQRALLTSKGREALRAASRIHLRGVARGFADVLDAREVRTLRKALERVAGAPT